MPFSNLGTLPNSTPHFPCLTQNSWFTALSPRDSTTVMLSSLGFQASTFTSYNTYKTGLLGSWWGCVNSTISPPSCKHCTGSLWNTGWSTKSPSSLTVVCMAMPHNLLQGTTWEPDFLPYALLQHGQPPQGPQNQTAQHRWSSVLLGNSQALECLTWSPESAPDSGLF